MKSPAFRVVAFAVMLGLAACSKKTDQPADAAVDAAPAAATAATAATAPAAAPAPAATPEDPQLAAKRKAIEFAMLEDGYKNDPLGQWAVSAKASSTFAGETAKEDAAYHAFRATGAPDTERHGDVGTAWAPKDRDAGIEWIELAYAKPVHATEVRIRQNNAPGAIVKVELFDEKSGAHTVWQGPDATAYPESEIAWLNAKFDRTAFTTQRLKITLATNAVPGWNEIDAVQLVGE